MYIYICIYIYRYSHPWWFTIFTFDVAIVGNLLHAAIKFKWFDFFDLHCASIVAETFRLAGGSPKVMCNDWHMLFVFVRSHLHLLVVCLYQTSWYTTSSTPNGLLCLPTSGCWNIPSEWFVKYSVAHISKLVDVDRIPHIPGFVEDHAIFPHIFPLVNPPEMDRGGHFYMGPEVNQVFVASIPTSSTTP